MTDIQIIAEVVGTDKVNSLIKSTQSLESRVKKLGQAYRSGKVGPEQFNKGLTELRKSAQSLYPSHQKASAVVSKLSRDYLKAAKAQDAYSAAQKQERQAIKAYTQARREATEANQRFDAQQAQIAKAAKEAADATRRQAREIDRLKGKYVENYSASQRYKQEIRDLLRAKRQGIVTTDQYGDSIQRLKSDFRDLQNGVVKGSNQFASYNTATYNANQRTKRFASVGLQQAGYQVGDFAVQLQGGTNAAVAFGQQGSQLLGIFGAWGAVAGAALAIATAFAAPLLDMATAADEASEKMEDFKENLKSARETVKGMTDDLRLLKSGFKDAFELTLVDNIEKAENKLKEAQAEYRALIRLAEEEIAASGLSGSSVKPEDIVGKGRIEAAKEAVEAAKEELRLAKETAKELEFANSVHEAADNFADARNRALEKGVEKERELSQALLDYGIEMAGVLKKSQNLKDEIGEAAYNALQIAGVDMQSPIDNAAKASAQLAVKLGVSLERLREMRDMTPAQAATGGFIGSRRGPGQRPDDPGASRGPSTMEIPTPSTPTSSGSGGGVQTNPRAFLESLQKELDLKRLLVGVNEEQAERLKIEAKLKERLREVGGKLTEADRSRIDALVKQAEAIRKAEAAEERRRNSIERFENQMSDSITNIVKETESIQDAFLNVIGNIVEQLYKQHVAGPISSGIGDILGGLFGGTTANANGNAFNKGKVTAFATGGVVDKPTMFPMANGAGLMGEAGPEAVMPLKRGKNGKLGVSSEGGSGGSVTVNNHFHIAANGDDSVKRIISQEAPKIAELTQKQILDRRSRGGVFKTTFG